MTSGSCVKSGINHGALMINNTEINVRKTILKKAERQTDSSARSGWPPPRFCPTSVDAAEAIPHAGRTVKIIIRMPMEYPATAASPKSAMMRRINNQLVVVMANCNTPVNETLNNLRIISPTHLKPSGCDTVSCRDAGGLDEAEGMADLLLQVEPLRPGKPPHNEMGNL